MNRFIGRAVFLASVTMLSIWPAGTAAANSSRPIFACFSPQNAAAIGALGANDPSVRYGFESGECLALPAGVPLNDVERSGNLWRFRMFGAQPYLYAADWAAGFQPAAPAGPGGFEQFLPVTARLMADGRAFADCYDASSKLAARIEDHARRWRDYQSWGGGTKPNGSGSVVIIYVGDMGPRLAAEDIALRQQSRDLDRRCRQYAAMEADDDFLAFIRTARRA
jgi:hypothetical protein